MPTYPIAAVDVVHNDEDLRLNLDLLEERRERSAIREAKAKLKMTKYYNVRDLDKTTWGGRFVAIGTIPVCCRSTGRLGRGCWVLAGKS
nr:hypothetical protein [Tanacetum cinerariifolium]